ncbi:MAG: MurR/RpiR family transcriptional regulator [Clostridia bacterium]|nr:MurR/RpiR family transcriptional regulator [Clostridia bacterium]
MKSILLNMRSLYNEMGPGERKIADRLIANPKAILPLSITEFATEIGCGDATVVRFAKRLGVGGYQGLKLAVAQEISTLSDENAQISKSDSCYDMFVKRIGEIKVALENTASVLDENSLEAAAKAIMHSKRIVIFGLGNSASIAVDAQHKFLRVGLNASACNDNHMQAIISSHLDEDCVAIGITHSGQSTDIVQALKIAKLNSATTICITNYGESPITKVSDICLFTKSAETKHSILAMSSRIAQLTIFDCLYTYIIANSDSKAIQAIHNTESALKDKKL